MQANESTSNPEYTKIRGSLIKYILAAGSAIFFLSFGFLYLAFKFMPQFFETYLEDMFNAGGDRDLFFYLHPFVMAAGLAILWYRFRRYLVGNIIFQGIEFGLIYGIIALVPILWITYSAINVSELMIFSWFLYGTTQACIAGIVFAWLNSKN